MYFLLSQLISKLFLRENGANKKFLILCDRRAAKKQKVNIQMFKKVLVIQNETFNNKFSLI